MKSGIARNLLLVSMIFIVVFSLGCLKQEECGDSDCTGSETCSTCEQDCGVCSSVEICDNGADEDGDGMIDCLDADCSQSTYCAGMGIELLCSDGMDNDNDGLMDCMDTDCSADIMCQAATTELICNDDVDNDNDGLMDCMDTDCALDTNCAPEEPDLQVKSVELSGEANLDVPLKIMAVVENLGAEISNNYYIKFAYWYQDSMYDYAQIENVQISGIHEFGQEKLVSVIWTPIKTGDLKLRIFIDSGETIDEGNEENNVMLKDVEVMTPTVFCTYSMNTTTKTKVHYSADRCSITRRTHITGNVGDYAKMNLDGAQYTIINGKTVYFKEATRDYSNNYKPEFNINGKDGIHVEGSLVEIDKESMFEYDDMKCNVLVKGVSEVWIKESPTCDIVDDSLIVGSNNGGNVTTVENRYMLIEEQLVHVKEIETREYGDVEEIVIVVKRYGSSVEKEMVPGEQFRPTFVVNGDEILGEWLKVGEETIFGHS